MTAHDNLLDVSADLVPVCVTVLKTKVEFLVTFVYNTVDLQYEAEDCPTKTQSFPLHFLTRVTDELTSRGFSSDDGGRSYFPDDFDTRVRNRGDA
jgi:hypothetical protein